MDRVLGTFDGVVDNATGIFSAAAGKARNTGAQLVEKGGDITGSLGAQARDTASDIGTVIGENFDAAMTFAKSLFGG